MDAFAGEIELMAARIAVASGTPSPDPFAEAGRIFAEVARETLGDTPPDAESVRRAALLAVADQAWTGRLGSLLDTGDVVQLLGVSKQRVSALVSEGRLIALPQEGRKRFPAWQFALSRVQDRECLAGAHEALVRIGEVSPWTAASWFQSSHPALDGTDPVTFLDRGGDRTRVRQVAERDAARLSQ